MLPAVITFVAYWLMAIPGGYVFGVHGKFWPWESGWRGRRGWASPRCFWRGGLRG
jgi:hypothetical protein